MLDSIWTGLFTLKKNAFSNKFYVLAGNSKFASSMLPKCVGNSNNEVTSTPNLHINQRIRLDSSKLDDIEKRLMMSDNANTGLDTYAVLLALSVDIGEYLIQHFSAPFRL